MIVDNKIIKWRERMRDVMFSNFDEFKTVADVLLIVRANEDKLDHITFEIGDTEKSEIRQKIINIINESSPDAYMVIMTHGMVIGKSSDVEKMKTEFKEVGSVEKMRNNKEVVVITYETKLVSNVEIYEVIREDNHAIINKEPLLNAMDIKENVFFTGILNRDRQLKLIQIVN